MVQTEQGTKVDRLVSIDIAERFEALQDEVDLLKVEVKQTLVDLREFIMKGKSVFPAKQSVPPLREVPPISESAPEPVIEASRPEPVPYIVPVSDVSMSDEPIPSAHSETAPSAVAPTPSTVPAPASNAMDSAMMARIVEWLGTIKSRGMSLQQLTPFLEAYESAGYMSSLMVKVVIRSVADLDQATRDIEPMRFSPMSYAECIGDLHQIVCGSQEVEPQPTQPQAVTENLLWLERC